MSENDNSDLLLLAETSKNSQGGTEFLARKLFSLMPRELLEKFQIWISRYVPERVDKTKIQILWCHDWLEPMYNHLKDNGWSKFNRIVFVSNIQMQHFINYYQIPWSKCLVLPNAIEPIENQHIFNSLEKTIRIGYWSVPRKGLQILVPTFEELCKRHDNIELHVTSSFDLYGWPQADEQFKALLERCQNNPKIIYSKSVSNEEMRHRITTYDILALPSTFPETSCLCLMEAMSAGLVCIHPNFGALSETATNWTFQYQYFEDMSRHAQILYQVLNVAIEQLQNKTSREMLEGRLKGQKMYADIYYCWQKRRAEWFATLMSLSNEPPATQQESAGFFTYKVG